MQGALQVFNKYVEIRPDDPVALQDRAYTYILSGNFDLAHADLTHAITITPELTFSRVLQGVAFIGQHDLDQADTQFLGVLSQHPHNVAALFGHARVAELRGKIGEARIGYTSAIGETISRDYDRMHDFKDEARARLVSLSSAMEVPTPIVKAAPNDTIATVVSLEPPPRATSTKLTSPSNPVQLAAFKMLDTHCARCHQTDKTDGLNKAQSKVANILDLQALAAEKALGDAGQSAEIVAVLHGSAPGDAL